MNILLEIEESILNISSFPPLTWKEFFSEVSTTLEAIDCKLEGEKFYPPVSIIFRSFFLTPLNDIKVVIVGQDPYYTKDYATGLAFSCDCAIPDSLANIFKNLEKTVDGFEIPKSGDLTKWAIQGVFLINTALTVEPGKPNSHKKIWDEFTKTLFTTLQKKKKVVYMLWGAHAQYYRRYINDKENLILETSHPSPMSVYRGFSDSDHFNSANKYLRENDIKEINWKLK